MFLSKIWFILIALVFGAAVAYGLLRTRFVPNLLDVLAVAPVVFLVVILLSGAKIIGPIADFVLGILLGPRYGTLPVIR